MKEYDDKEEKVDQVQQVFNNIKKYYIIYYGDPPIYSLKSTAFFEIEPNIYNLQKRIDDLNIMISSLLDKLNLIDFPDKNYIIEQLNKKKRIDKIISNKIQKNI